jgi:hypothetical protein
LYGSSRKHHFKQQLHCCTGMFTTLLHSNDQYCHLFRGLCLAMGLYATIYFPIHYSFTNHHVIRRYTVWDIECLKKYKKRALRLVRTEALCSIIIEFSTSMKLVWQIKTCLNDAKFHMRNHLSDISSPQLCEARKCFIADGFQLFFRMCHHEGLRKPGGIGIEWDTSASSLC